MQSNLNVFSIAGSGQALSPGSSPTFVNGTFTGTLNVTGTTTLGNVTQTGNTTQIGTETVLGLSTSSNFETAQLSAPAAPVSVVPATSGSTTYTYGYTAVDALGKETQLTNTLATALAANTLSGTNTVTVTAPALPAGAASMKLYRTTNGQTASAIGVIATGIAGGGVTIDTGLSATVYLYSSAYPSQNYTGGIQTNTRAPNWINSCDPSKFAEWDDFQRIAGNNAISTAVSLSSQLNWGAIQISSGVGVIEPQPVADGIHFGAAQIGTSSTTTGYGVALYRGGGPNNESLLNPSTALFDLVIGFQLQSAASQFTYIGFCANASQSTIPSANSTAFVGLSWDTSVDTTNFQFRAQAASAGGASSSGIAADANWHKFRMRSVVAGTILMSLDDGPETSLSSNINNAYNDFVIQQGTRTSTAKYVWVDYYGCQITGLKR